MSDLTQCLVHYEHPVVQIRNRCVGESERATRRRQLPEKIAPTMINDKITHIMQSTCPVKGQKAAWALKSLVKGWNQTDGSVLEVFTCSKGLKRTKPVRAAARIIKVVLFSIPFFYHLKHLEPVHLVCALLCILSAMSYPWIVSLHSFGSCANVQWGFTCENQFSVPNTLPFLPNLVLPASSSLATW